MTDTIPEEKLAEIKVIADILANAIGSAIGQQICNVKMAEPQLLRQKLWCDVYVAKIGAGNAFAETVANKAVIDFEVRFKLGDHSEQF